MAGLDESQGEKPRPEAEKWGRGGGGGNTGLQVNATVGQSGQLVGPGWVRLACPRPRGLLLLALGPGKNPRTVVVSFRPVVVMILPKGQALSEEQKHLETTVFAASGPWELKELPWLSTGEGRQAFPGPASPQAKPQGN